MGSWGLGARTAHGFSMAGSYAIMNEETWPVRPTERKTLKPLDERPDEKVSVIIQLKIKAGGRLSLLPGRQFPGLLSCSCSGSDGLPWGRDRSERRVAGSKPAPSRDRLFDSSHSDWCEIPQCGFDMHFSDNE